ncbi:armadillo-type protein [Blastocladiella britannica]|nr:armadillo-type protein [Blastocladiella britannica]
MSVHFVMVYTHHFDAGVRRAALEALIKLQERFGACGTDVSVYHCAVQGIHDKDTLVRSSSLRLMRMVATHFSDRPAPIQPTAPSSSLSIVDDAFMRIASLIVDPVVSVRRVAATELGALRNVTDTLLHQSLSKKLVDDTSSASPMTSSLPPRPGSRSPPNRRFERLEGSDGQMPTEWKAYAGAFVHAMEDEHHEVRLAAIVSIAQLANTHPAFASQSVYFLVEMTNDETPAVRNSALTALIGIAKRPDSPVVLTPLDLDDLTDLFGDPAAVVRHALYRFIGHVKLPAKESLMWLQRELRRNLDRFGSLPGAAATAGGLNVSATEAHEEHTRILECVRRIAENNVDLVAAEGPTILGLDPRYLRQEVHATDIHHISKVVLVYNAALVRPKLMALIPQFVRQQVTFIRMRYPSSLPPPGHQTRSIVQSSEHDGTFRQATMDRLVRSLDQALQLDPQQLHQSRLADLHDQTTLILQEGGLPPRLRLLLDIASIVMASQTSVTPRSAVSEMAAHIGLSFTLPSRPLDTPSLQEIWRDVVLPSNISTGTTTGMAHSMRASVTEAAKRTLQVLSNTAGAVVHDCGSLVCVTAAEYGGMVRVPARVPLDVVVRVHGLARRVVEAPGGLVVRVAWPDGARDAVALRITSVVADTTDGGDGDDAHRDGDGGDRREKDNNNEEKASMEAAVVVQGMARIGARTWSAPSRVTISLGRRALDHTVDDGDGLHVWDGCVSVSNRVEMWIHFA